MITKYNKFLVALAGFVAVAALAVSDGKLTGEEDSALVGAAIVALGVLGIRNKGYADATVVAAAVAEAMAHRIPDIEVPAEVAEAAEVAAEVADAVSKA